MSIRKMQPLRGKGIVVTRPAHQAERLCELIEAQGGTAIRFPTLEIQEPQNPAAVQAILDRLDEYDLAIFVSPNAVQRAWPLILERGGPPPRLKLAAVGKGTARALERLGSAVHCHPADTFNSETLLALPVMRAVSGQNIVIFRGEGGRELLRETLRQRGAAVSYAEVYRRARPAAEPDRLIRSWQRGEIHAVVVTSVESLRNLFDMLDQPGRQWLLDTPLIVVSERIRQAAQAFGLRRPPLLAREVSDEAIVEALLQLNQETDTNTLGTRHDG